MQFLKKWSHENMKPLIIMKFQTKKSDELKSVWRKLKTMPQMSQTQNSFNSDD